MLFYVMDKINKLLKKIRVSFHGILDLDSYRELCLELSMLQNLIEIEKKKAYRKGILDCERTIRERLASLCDT